MIEKINSSGLGAVIVGTGFGVLTHLRALRLAGIEVHALVGRNPEKTSDRAKQSGVPHGLTSLAEALALPGVDIVTVATPPHTHADIVLETIAAGKHVMCEKPFARDLEEAKRMQAAAEEAGVVNAVGMEFRFDTGQALAARAIREGVIGDPRIATFLMHVPVLADPKGEVPAWWSSKSNGGGWLGAYASHIIDQVRCTLGEITGLSASLFLVSDRDWSAEDSYSIHFRTANGCDGILQSTAGAWGPMLIGTRFAGSKGTLWIEGDWFEGIKIQVADSSGTRTLDIPEDLKTLPPASPPQELMHTAYDYLHAAGFDIGPYTRVFETMSDEILGRELPSDPVHATFADGTRCQAVLDAIRKSSAERCWVELDQVIK